MRAAQFTFALALFASASPALAYDDMAVGGTHLASPSPYRAARSGQVWSVTVGEPGAASASVYFSRLGLDADDYVVVSNGDQEQLFTAGDGEGFWTEPLPGGVLHVSLFATGRSTGAGVLIDRYRVSTSPNPTMSIYQRNDLVPIAQAPEEVYAERGPVARVFMQGVGYCTGFLFAPNLLMTNNHCVSTEATCRGTVAEFNYETDVNGLPLPATEVACAELVETDYTLDYSVLRLEGMPGQEWGTYALSAEAPPTGEQGTVIQHPAGMRKQAALAPNCTIGAVANGNGTNTDFKHQCDTEGGSSGAPVLSADFEVVGLHHFGGAGWAPRSANQAVRMDRIVEQCGSCAQ